MYDYTDVSDMFNGLEIEKGVYYDFPRVCRKEYGNMTTYFDEDQSILLQNIHRLLSF